MVRGYYQYVQTPKGRYEWISYGQAILLFLCIVGFCLAVMHYIID